MIFSVRTKLESLTQRMNRLSPKKPQNNKFVESGLKNWAKMSWMANKVDLNDKNRKINGFQLKKVVLE